MKKILSQVIPFIGKFAKGAVKSLPFGNTVIDGIENATSKEPKHDKIVWVAEMLGLVCVVGYLVHKNILTVDVLKDLIDSIVNNL